MQITLYLKPADRYSTKYMITLSEIRAAKLISKFMEICFEITQTLINRVRN